MIDVKHIFENAILDESLGNLSQLTDKDIKSLIVKMLKNHEFRKVSGTSPDSKISHEITCKHSEIIKVLKREQSIHGNISTVVVDAGEGRRGFVQFWNDEGEPDVSASAKVYVFGGYQGYDFTSSFRRETRKVSTLSNALKYFHQTWYKTAVTVGEIKDVDVKLVIIYADQKKLDKVADREQSRKFNDKYDPVDAYGWSTETPFMKNAKQQAREIRDNRMAAGFGNMSSTAPDFVYKLREIDKNTAYGSNITFVVDGVEYKSVTIDTKPSLTITQSGAYIDIGRMYKVGGGSVYIRLTQNGIQLVSR